MRHQTKKVLSPEPDFGFTLLAIVCVLKDYRLAHFINKELGLGLVRNVQYPEYTAAGQANDGYFNLFSSYVEESETEYHFFSNKGSAGYVIPEMRDADHFLLIVPGGTRSDSELLNSLLKMERVEAAFNLDVRRLRSKANLLFF